MEEAGEPNMEDERQEGSQALNTGHGRNLDTDDPGRRSDLDVKRPKDESAEAFQNISDFFKNCNQWALPTKARGAVNDFAGKWREVLMDANREDSASGESASGSEVC